jgi:hypothetical protein
MANPEHLAILKQGVEEWNKWRGEHSELEPDLSRADLAAMDITGADLTGDERRQAGAVSGPPSGV